MRCVLQPALTEEALLQLPAPKYVVEILPPGTPPPEGACIGGPVSSSSATNAPTRTAAAANGCPPAAVGPGPGAGRPHPSEQQLQEEAVAAAGAFRALQAAAAGLTSPVAEAPGGRLLGQGEARAWEEEGGGRHRHHGMGAQCARADQLPGTFPDVAWGFCIVTCPSCSCSLLLALTPLLLLLVLLLPLPPACLLAPPPLRRPLAPRPGAPGVCQPRHLPRQPPGHPSPGAGHLCHTCPGRLPAGRPAEHLPTHTSGSCAGV